MAMIAADLALAAVVKSGQRQVPLAALVFAAIWLDLVFLVLQAVGVERVEAAPGTSGALYGQTVMHADYTHSLAGAAMLSLTFGIAAAVWWSVRTGAVLGLVAFSHWFLDLVTHRADLAIAPLLDAPRLGFGLWTTPVWSVGIELLLVVAGGLLYWRAAMRTAPPDRRGLAQLNGALVIVSGVAILALTLFGL
jgi:membrane-bound metal-dependent hydrolase YbcI (DUF457 family)